MTLTDLEYGVIMQAINNAKNEIAEDTFIDPYNNEFEVTNEQCLEALEDKSTDQLLTELQAIYDHYDKTGEVYSLTDFEEIIVELTNREER